MNAYGSLLTTIRQVRRKWRSQILVKGISLFLASTIAFLMLGVWGADLFGFKSSVVWMIRILAGATVLFTGWYFLCVPLRARITNVQIARFVEEKYPQLEDRLVAAVEHGGNAAESKSMIDLLIKDALDKTAAIDLSVFLDRKRLLSFALTGFSALLGLFLLLNWGPSFFPYGFSYLYAPWTQASLGSSLMIKIAPGDVELAKGSDQQIHAQLIGFDSSDVRLLSQVEGSATWNASVMEPESRGSGFQYLLVDLRSSVRYYVESKGVKSKACLIRVQDLAKVDAIDLTYHFPAYAGMVDQTVRNEGDISALKGTRVDLRIRLSRPAESARLLFDNQSVLDLSRGTAQDFAGTLTLQRSGSYVVQITEPRGSTHPGSAEYGIEALDDQVPKVTITRPMRDVRATSVEEVFSEVKGEDDIGVGKLELHYSVNGGAERSVDLYTGKPPKTSVIGSHTFLLEEFGLQPGDVISYYAKGWDNNNATGPGNASSDIYFIQVRPFEQKYTQNQQSGMSGQGGEREEALSKQQKDIISATFRLIREKSRMESKEYQDGLKSLALVQTRLQLQAQNVVDRMQRRGAVQVDDKFRKLSEYLRTAIQEMEKAAANLGAQKPDGAMPNEQKSLQQLMRAESLFREIQVSFAAQGGGSGAQTNAEDLADLFELELNKLKNQYETVQRGEEQARDQKVDEAMEKLKELARRQQQLNERNRMLGQQGKSASSGGEPQNQQELIQQAEQMQRQLQRLSRERSSPQINEAGSQIQKAIDEMKRALGNSQNQNSAESTAQGIRALQQLEDAARKLSQGQRAGFAQRLDGAVEESKSLVEEQKRIQEGLERLSKDKPPAGLSESGRQLREDMVSRKTSLADRLRSLNNQIQDLSRQTRKSQKETSDRLGEAARGIQDSRLPDRIMSGNPMIQNGYYDGQKQREDFIRGSLEALNKQLETARNSAGQSKEGKLEEAASRARQLAEGLESMQQRMNQAQQGKEGNGQRQGPPSARQDSGQEPQGQKGGSMQTGPISGGQAEATVRNGRPSPGTDARTPSGNTIGPPIGTGTPGNEEARQLGRELQQRLTDARDLKPLLDVNSTQMKNLEKVIESLRRTGDYTNQGNPEQIARLKSAIDYMRKVEFDLSRDLEKLNQSERYLSEEENGSPDRYRKLVEEYYRSVAKSR